jgi:outer membrane protein
MVVALALAAIMAAGVAHAEDKLAFVDIQRALNDCHNGKVARAEFKTRLQRVQSQLEREQSEVQSLKDEIEKKGSLMQPDERQSVENEYAKKLRDFQADYKTSSDELQQRDRQMTGAIVRDLAMVVQQIGRRDGYTMVMEKGSLLWATPSIDITDQVIRAYDAMNVKPGSLAAEAEQSPGGTSFGSRAGSGAPPSSSSSMESGRSTISK